MDPTPRPAGVGRDPTGANQAAAADHNARLVASLLRRDGPLPGSEIARRCGLTAPAVSGIVRRLEEAGLVERGEALRGQVGKPRVPVRLAPGGARALGLKVGRRSAELVMVDLAGAITARRALSYPAPAPDALARFLRRAVPALVASGTGRPPCGVGVAMPYQIWAWHGSVPSAPRAEWEALDLGGLLSRLAGVPVALRNDMTCAARAELAWGPPRAARDWAYVHVGALVGGGVVLDGRVRDGRQGNAGAFGPLAVAGPDGRPAQLFDLASLWPLERAVGRDLSDYPWDPGDPVLAAWIDGAAAGLSRAAVSLCAVLDFEALVIDGLFPARIRDRLVAETAARLADEDMRGLLAPAVEPGTIGAPARALGAATVVLERAHFLTD